MRLLCAEQTVRRLRLRRIGRLQQSKIVAHWRADRITYAETVAVERDGHNEIFGFVVHVFGHHEVHVRRAQRTVQFVEKLISVGRLNCGGSRNKKNHPQSKHDDENDNIQNTRLLLATIGERTQRDVLGVNS